MNTIIDGRKAQRDAQTSGSLKIGQLFDGVRIHRDAYVSDEVFRLEMEHIFLASWIYVGHESEVPQRGDYKTTTLGAEPVILCRDRDLRLHVIVNRCRHRAAKVCTGVAGNTDAFRCSYHGWAYRHDGTLIGVPYPDGYGVLDSTKNGLSRAPLVESYRGFIFASFSEAVPSLADHLAGAIPYLDAVVDHCAGHELAVTKVSHQVEGDFNWKLQMENGLDGYHALFTHKSFFDLMERRTGKVIRRDIKDPRYKAKSRHLGNGHTVLESDRGEQRKRLVQRLETLNGARAAMEAAQKFSASDAQALYEATVGTGFNLGIFPNLQVIGIHIREIRPLTPNRTLVTLRPLVVKSAPVALNALRLRLHEQFYGHAGFGQPDDAAIFERIGYGLNDQIDPWVKLDRGIHRQTVDEIGESGDMSDEVPQRAQYRHWSELMTAGATR